MDFFAQPFSFEAALRLLLVACAAFVVGVAWVPIMGAIMDLLKGGEDALPARNHREPSEKNSLQI